MYTMTFNDGTKLEGLTLKNNCLITAQPVTPSAFAGKLNPVTITGTKGDSDDEDFGGLIGTHKHMGVAWIKPSGTGSAVALYDIADSDWDMAQLKGNVEFIAMMTGVEL